MNIFQKAITPDMPRVLEGEQIYVYVPQATSTNAGIASYKNEDFKVNDGVVSLRWPAKSFTKGPLANPSLIKVQEDEFEYTNAEVNLDYEGSRLTSSIVDVQLKRDLRDAYDRPDLVMLDQNYFPREIIEKDGKQYYKYNTTAVHYIIQALTDAQKRQARENIDAGSNQDIKSVNDRVDKILTSKVTSVNGKSGDVILKNSDLENDTNYSTIDFVNSSIATNTATFRGTYNSLSDLLAYAGDKDDNDYAFVIEVDSVGNTLYNRYKYNGTEWLFEYSLNNSSFTQKQWTAINSGITDELTKQIIINTNKLSGIEAGAQVNTVTSVNNKTGLVVLTADDVNAVATSGGTIDGYLKIKGKAEERHLITRGIGGCSADTTTQDDLFINYGTEYGLKVGKTGQFGVDKDGNIITSGNIQGFTIYENDISLIDKYQQIGDYASNTALNEVEKVANYAKEKADEALTQVVEGLGSKIYINEVLAETINFTSDPQSQINTINTNKADATYVNEQINTLDTNKADITYVDQQINTLDTNKADITYVDQQISVLDTSKADITYVDQKVADLVGSAPDTLDTLEELATAFEENTDVVKTLEDAIVTKVAKTDVEDFLNVTSINPVQNKVITKALEEKVDKIDGKDLSTNDFTDDYKSQVENNTTVRHTHNNKTLLDTYTQTETNLADAVEKKHIHSNKSILDRTTASYTTGNVISVTFAESERQKSKNLWGSELQKGCYLFSNGVLDGGNSDYICNKTLISVKPNSTIIISATGFELNNDSGFVFFKDGEYIGYSSNVVSTIVPSNANQVGFNFYKTGIGNDFSLISNIQLEEGEVVTDYQPHNGPIVHENNSALVFAENERQNSKNLIPFPFKNLTSTKNGITFTTNADQSITVNGTISSNTSNGFMYLISGLSLEAGIYTLSAEKSIVDSQFGVVLYDGTTYYDSPLTFTLTEPKSVDVYVQVRKTSTTTYTNATIKVMLCKGTDTDWQPYNGAIVHEKEIADVEHIETIYDMNTKNIINNIAYTSGIPLYDGLTITHDFSKFKKYDFIYEPNTHTSNWFGSARTITVHDMIVCDGVFTYFDCVSPSNSYAQALARVEIYTQIRLSSNKQSVSFISYLIDSGGGRSAIKSGNSNFYRLVRIVGYK